MAILIPSNYPPLRTDAGLYRELEVLDRLQHSLPDTYEIFHSVEWHSIDKGSDRRWIGGKRKQRSMVCAKQCRCL